MVRRWLRIFCGVFLTGAGLGLTASCRDGDARARGQVLEAGFVFTIEGYLQAAGDGRSEVVAQFLEAGMRVDASGPGGETALLRAARKGQAHVVRQLLAAGAQAEAADAQGAVPLVAAAETGDAESVRILRGAGSEAGRKTAMRAGLERAAWAGHAEVVSLLMEDMPDPLEPALLLACKEGHTGVMDVLLMEITNRRQEAVDWLRVLMTAGQTGHLPAVKLLVSRMPGGADFEKWCRQAARDIRLLAAENPQPALKPGQDAVADFLESEASGRGSPEVAAIQVGGKTDVADEGNGALPDDKREEEEMADGAQPGEDGTAAENEAANVPESKPKPPGRLGGKRFPKISCEAMHEVPDRLKMVAWEPQMWPVILQDVADGHGSAQVLLSQEPPRTVTLKVGDEIPGTGCVIGKLKRRRIYTDAAETQLKNVSEMHFRRESDGQQFKALAGESVLSNDSTARLIIDGTEQPWGAVPGDEFRLGSLLLRVKQIAEGSIVLESRLTRETVSVPLTRQP